MMGLATQLFAETEGYPPWLKQKKPRWPLIQKGCLLGCFSYVDMVLAERLLRDYPEVAETAAAFLCHLSRATREGHICVQVDCNSLSPSPLDLWFSDGGGDEIEDLLHLAKNLSEGAKELPETLFSDGATPLCRLNDGYYFQKYWLLESLFLEHFHRLMNAPPALAVSDNPQSIDILNPQQQEAVNNALKNCFSVISGGPGTGKTFTAGHLIRHFWEALTPEQRETCQICLAAPTGKAASNLQKSLQSATSNLDGFSPLKAQTLHALLGIRTPSMHGSPKPLRADLILVDESSMIDIRMMAMLFASVKTGARLVLLGDRFQLPPVEAGSLFADILACLQSRGCVSELTTCLRVERQAMVDLASAINRGDSAAMFNLLKGEDIHWMELNDSGRGSQEELVNYAASQFPYPAVRDELDESLLSRFNHFRILTPLRKGFFGVEELNQQILGRMIRKVRFGTSFAIPIMIVANDYKMELFNGEVGVLIRHSVGDEDYVLFPSGDGGPCRKIPAVLLPKYEYAYVLSVHKSQGSEFDHVLMLLPEGAAVFGREVLYTAVTRAKKRLEVWSHTATLTKTLSKTSTRVSGISKRS